MSQMWRPRCDITPETKRPRRRDDCQADQNNLSGGSTYRLPSKETRRRRKRRLQAIYGAELCGGTPALDTQLPDDDSRRVLPVSETATTEPLDLMDEEVFRELYEMPYHSNVSDEGSLTEESQIGALASGQDLTCDPDDEVENSSDDGTADSSNSNIHGFSVMKLKEFIRYGGDAVMFEEANLMVWQVVLIILGLCHRYSLSATGRRALIEATRLFAGPTFASWDITDYEISQVFDPPDEVIKYTFYCEVCYQKLGEETTKRTFRNHEAVCERCLQTYQLSKNSPNYFLNLDLRYQLKSLMSLPIIIKGLRDNLVHVEDRLRSIEDGMLTDVYDSLLYKKLVESTESNSRLLTYIVNTDGAPLFNSSKRGFWPIQLIINELPPDIRFKYPLLVGLAVGKKEPSPDLINIFFESFIHEANKLSTVGFEVNMGEGNIVRFLLKPLACSVDSVARPILQNRLQFNGYHGCSWCYSIGVHTNGCMRFLMEETEPADRTHEAFKEDLHAVLKKIESTSHNSRSKRINVRGVKGWSVLTRLKGFDMIWGFVRDYLHADLAGVVTQMTTMWCDSDCPVRLTKQQFMEVNERLMIMTPPHEVHRLVRPIVTERAKWKASEWRSWLLFYSIPCLTGILPHYALQHFALFVRSIFLLLKRNITEDDLQMAESDLQRFVIIFELLYGERYVTFNIHSLHHLVRSVRSCGPLWATSTFPFESAIRQLKGSVHGAKGVYEQIAKRATHGIILQNLVQEMEESAASIAFHKSLYGRPPVTTATVHRSEEGVVLIGSGHLATQDDISGCEEVLHRDVSVYCHTRCVKSGMVICSVAYGRQNKSNDTMFRDIRGRFVQVLCLLRQNDAAFAKVSYFQSTNIVIPNVEDSRARFEDTCGILINDVVLDHLFILEEERCSTIVIPVGELKEKCVLMKVSGRTYVSTLPNTIEIQ